MFCIDLIGLLVAICGFDCLLFDFGLLVFCLFDVCGLFALPFVVLLF